MRKDCYTVACLTGHGVGPEVMAEASRTLDAVSRLHGFRVEQLHVPFDREALVRSGHSLPVATRAAYRTADAVLVAGASGGALPGVKADLELAATVERIRLQPGGDLNVFAPLADGAENWAIEQAFVCAGGSRGRLTSIGTDECLAVERHVQLLDPEAVQPRNRVESPARLAHHFRADTVARQAGDGVAILPHEASTSSNTS